MYLPKCLCNNCRCGPSAGALAAEGVGAASDVAYSAYKISRLTSVSRVAKKFGENVVSHTGLFLFHINLSYSI